MIGLKIIQQICESFSQNLALNIDLSKAFDCIEWKLVTYLLRRMNFPDLFVQLIHKFISTTQISIRSIVKELHILNPPGPTSG